MAIISVQQPQREEKKERKDPFEDIIKGLNVAQSVFGIASSAQQMGVNKLQKQRLEQQIKEGEIEGKRQQQLAEGLITPDIERQIYKVPEGTTNARQGRSTVTGETFFYQTPADIEKQQNENKLQIAIDASDLEKKAKAGEKSDKLTADLQEKVAKHKITSDLDMRYIAYRNAEEFLKSNSPAAQSAAVFNFLKSMDPTSTVRDTERADVQNATSVPDRARNYWNQVFEGRPLNPEQMQDLVNISKSILKTQLAAYNDVLLPQYYAIGRQMGANTSLIANPVYVDLYKTIDKMPVQQKQPFQPNMSISRQPSIPFESKAQAGLEDPLAKYNKKMAPKSSPTIIPYAPKKRSE